jgi:hypothetical protein
MKNLCR